MSFAACSILGWERADEARAPSLSGAGARITQGGGGTGLHRVPTTFVLKYTLTAQPEPSGGHEAVEGGAGHARDLGDRGLGHAQLEEVTDFMLLAVEP